MEAPAGTQAVDRAAALIALVVRSPEPLTSSALADSAGLARSTTSRLLTALERARLLARDDDGAYVPGPLFAQYATRHDPSAALVRLATPTLQRLGDDTGETVNLGVAHGDTVVQVAQVDARYVLGARDWVGVDVPPHCSALGKVMYAFGGLTVPDGPLEQPTDKAIGSGAQLRRELARVRRDGFARARDELEVGLTAVAAPVRNRKGDVIAALGVSGPTARLATRADQTGRLVIEHADTLSRVLRRRMLEEGAA